MQSMSDDPLTNCTTCSASVQRVFHPVAVHFKGSGFYSTDYGKKGSASSTSDSKSDTKSDSKPDSKDSSKSSSSESSASSD